MENVVLKGTNKHRKTHSIFCIEFVAGIFILTVLPCRSSGVKHRNLCASVQNETP